MAQVGGIHDVGVVQFGSFTKAMADANQTLTSTEAENRTLITTGALTAQRNLTVPLVDGMEYVVDNQCTGFGVHVIGPTGTGVVVAAGRIAVVRCDGTNFRRVTADATP